MQVIIQAMDIPLPEAQADYDLLKNPLIKSAKDTRPCVILPTRGEEGAGCICLMATFEGSHPKNLPRIYQEFILPVHPNSGHPEYEYGAPLHSSPPWGEPNQWIIPIAIEPKGGNSGTLKKWMTPEMALGGHFCDEMLYKLMDACREKHSAWVKQLKLGGANTDGTHKYYKNMKVGYLQSFYAPATHTNFRNSTWPGSLPKAVKVVRWRASVPFLIHFLLSDLK